MLSYNEALNIIKYNFEYLNKNIIEVDILNSVNHIIAEDVFADINMPPFNNSAVDGYGIKYDSDIREWELIGEESAGNYKEYTVDKNTTVSIMTGGQVPESCTSVIPLEDVDVVVNSIKLKDGITIRDGKNIRKLGENIQTGELAVTKNTLINAHKISLLAACGKAKVKVYKPLKIGVLSTGDELVELKEKPTGDKIRATNLYSIIALLNKYNFEAVNFGFINDNREKIKSKIKEMLESDVDVLFTTGGVSVGKYDYLKEVFEELGVERKFWRAYIKPGKPIYFGLYQKSQKIKLIFGLAGNPVSSFVNFYVYFIPAFEQNLSVELAEKISASVVNSLTKKDGKRHFVRGNLNFNQETNSYEATSFTSQSSGNMVGLCNADCLIIFEEEKRTLEKGEIVECIRI